MWAFCWRLFPLEPWTLQKFKKTSKGRRGREREQKKKRIHCDRNEVVSNGPPKKRGGGRKKNDVQRANPTRGLFWSLAFVTVAGIGVLPQTSFGKASLQSLSQPSRVAPA
eukprot:TRINITY_DN6418_c3_g1_i1.p1 TRINITY_DN6418_c3_g1~~TRINITY_DN6418_c3_g1_i1.p1  ORF type:complete len:110 (-),score=7.82 TRINITY_DN6418_c3_g1_i1:145-474(-)